MFFYCIERPPRSWIPSQKFPLGVSLRALSRASSVCLGARKHRREAQSSTSPSQNKYRRPSFARAPSRSQFGDSFLRKLRFALVSRLGRSKYWLRQPFFDLIAKLLGSCCAPLNRWLWAHIERAQVLARESHGAFYLPQQLLPRPKGTAGQPVFLDICTSSLYFGIQLEYVACLMHCELEELGNHLEHTAIRTCNLESTAVKYVAHARPDGHFSGLGETTVPWFRNRSAKYETCLTPTRFSTRCRPRRIV